MSVKWERLNDRIMLATFLLLQTVQFLFLCLSSAVFLASINKIETSSTFVNLLFFGFVSKLIFDFVCFFVLKRLNKSGVRVIFEGILCCKKSEKIACKVCRL